MQRNLPPLNSLRFFEVAARHLSFTKAADELFVTQAAVSQQIKILETFLGQPLFIRENRRLQLTDTGRSYFHDITIILRKLIEVTEKSKVADKSQLTIKVPQTFGMNWLVPQLTHFQTLFPHIEVSISGVDTDESELMKDGAVAIYYGKGDWQGLLNHKLLSGELVILASPTLLKQQPIEQPSDLRQHHLIHIHRRENWQLMLDSLNIDNIDAQHGVVFSHTLMALQAAVHGQGIVVANKILAQKLINNGELVQVLNTALQDPKSFYVVCNPNDADNPVIQAFMTWIEKHIQQFH